VLVTTEPDVVDGADLVVLPGSRATLADLAWLRSTGIAAAVERRAARGAPVLGVCGGYQMLAATIEDPDDGGRVAATGLGLLPTRVDVSPAKVLGRPVGTWGGHRVQAYEIHHGVAAATGAAEPFLDGFRRGQVWGTMWHGSLENDGFRRAWLSEVAVAAGSGWRPAPGAPAYGARREAMIETLADAVDEHVDLELLLAGTRVAVGAGR
jgi:adenosylcobyric acid synthase